MRPLLIFVAAVAALAGCDGRTILLAGVSADTTNGNTLIITPNPATVTAGSSIQLATNAPLTQQSQVQWGSSNTTVATISPSGSVHGIRAGTVTISARYSFDTTRVATSTLNVIALPGTPGTAQRNP